MWQDSTFENTKMWRTHVVDAHDRCARQMHVVDARDRHVSKTSDAIAAPVKDDFPLTQLQFL